MVHRLLVRVCFALAQGLSAGVSVLLPGLFDLFHQCCDVWIVTMCREESREVMGCVGEKNLANIFDGTRCAFDVQNDVVDRSLGHKME